MSEAFAKIYRLGGEVKTFEVSEYDSVDEAIKGTGFEVKDGEAIRLNGEEIDGSEEIEDGDVITIVPKVKGGLK
jgi:sulfur carrier protein ThiS